MSQKPNSSRNYALRAQPEAISKARRKQFWEASRRSYHVMPSKPTLYVHQCLGLCQQESLRTEEVTRYCLEVIGCTRTQGGRKNVGTEANTRVTYRGQQEKHMERWIDTQLVPVRPWVKPQRSPGERKRKENRYKRDYQMV